MLRRLGVLSALLSLVGVGVALNAHAQQEQSSPDLAPATRTTFTIETTATGELEAKNQIEIRSKLEGQSTIVEIVPEGSVVKKGDVLIVLNAEQIRDRIAEEELRVESARNDHEAAIADRDIQETQNAADERNAKRELELARLALEQWEKGDHEKKLEQLRQAIASAERNLNRLEKKYERSKELYENNFLSFDEFEQDGIAYEEAKSRHKIAVLDKDTYDSYEAPRERKQKQAAVEDAETKLDRVTKQNEINLSRKSSDVFSRRRQLEMRTQQLDELNEQLDAATIIAPADGLVVYATSMERSRWGWGGDGPLQVGRQVHHNELLIALPDTSEMVASVRVHESLAGRIRPGQPAEVRIDAAGGSSFLGAVDSIGVLAESGGWRDPNRREYRVKINLDMETAGKELKPSMRCESTIALGSVEDAVAIPVQSVFADGPVRYVCIPNGSKFVRRPVKIGRRSSTLAEIVAGLEPGETVLTREPEPGELIRDAWNPDELELAGFSVDEEGKIVPIGGERARFGRRTTPTSGSGASAPAGAPAGG